MRPRRFHLPPVPRLIAAYFLTAAVLSTVGSFIPASRLFSWKDVTSSFLKKNSIAVTLKKKIFPNIHRPPEEFPPAPVKVADLGAAYRNFLGEGRLMAGVFSRLDGKSRHLENFPGPGGKGRALNTFFETLTEHGLAGYSNRVSICLLGDSVIGGDQIPYQLRLGLQGIFGDGGPGFILPGQPTMTHYHIYIDRESRRWATPSYRDFVSNTNDLSLGLGGYAFQADPAHYHTESLIQMKYSRRFQAWRVHYLTGPGRGSFFISNEGFSREVETEGSEASARSIYHDEHRPLDRLTISASGERPTRLFGVDLINTRGLALHTFSLLGGDYNALLSIKEDLWIQELRELRADLVVMMFGMNRSGWGILPGESYGWQIRTLIARVRAALPKVSVLVVGPMALGEEEDGEWKPKKIMLDIMRTQREAAESAGAAYLALHEALGGDFALGEWYGEKTELLSPDHIHPTPAGAEKIAKALQANLLRAYRDDLVRQGRLKEAAEKP